jgi:spore coat polysaccharide biosynthesis protein SpsF (cytidylyltransferase family)/methionyl-tRNA formyltransferase
MSEFESTKIDAIVQARTGSTRLPEKVLKHIDGEPMIKFLLRRLTLADSLDQIILATSNLPRDDRLAKIGNEMGIKIIRGSEEDVIDRFVKAAEIAASDIIIRVCADNPLTDPKIIDRVASRLVNDDIDHVSTFERHSYPYGVGCAGFTSETLYNINDITDDPDDREHVEPPMLRREDVNTLYLEAPDELSRPEIRVTVDHEFQYKKVKRVAEQLKESNGYKFTTKDIVEFFDDCPMIVFANGDLGYNCVKYLVENNEEIRGLVLHPPHEAKRRDDIKELVDIDKRDIISPDNLDDEWITAWVKKRNPEIILSFWSSFIFREDLIDIPPRGIVNLHNSLLPHCRGSGANIWTILEDKPGGVTLHYISPEIDKGSIIEQRKLPVHSWDTGKSLYYRQQDAMIELFEDKWSEIRVGPVETRRQEGNGSFHYYNEADQLRELDLDEEFTVRELIDRLRAFSFSPYNGCYFVDSNGNEINIHVELNRGISTRKDTNDEN